MGDKILVTRSSMSSLDEYVEEYDSELKNYFEAEAKEYYEQTTAD